MPMPEHLALVATNAAAYGTDKIGHGYLPHYITIAQELTDNHPSTDLRILEVGVARAEGLALFRDLFPDAWMLAGVDFDTTTRNPYGPILHESQDHPKLAERITEETGCTHWDLIVDDASHLPHPSAMTYARLIETVRPGGIYVIEDWNHARGIMDDTPWRIAAGAFNEQYGDPTIASVTILNGLVIVRKHPATVNVEQG